MQKQCLHPGGHGVVSGRGSVVNVNHENSHDNRQGHEHHDEQQVLPNERNDFGGRGDYFLNDQEEHRQGNQHRRRQGQLFALVGGEVEDEHGQEGQPQAGHDQEERVEQGQAAQHERVGDERIGVDAISPAALQPFCVEDLPFSVIEEVLPVNVLIDQNEVNHGSIVSPRAELHGAVLPVEWEKCDVHGARAFVTGGRRPNDGAVPSHDDFGHEGAFETAVGTVVRESNTDESGLCPPLPLLVAFIIFLLQSQTILQKGTVLLYPQSRTFLLIILSKSGFSISSPNLTSVFFFRDTYFSKRTMSGSQRDSDGTLIERIPPYSSGFQRNWWSVHSCIK